MTLNPISKQVFPRSRIYLYFKIGLREISTIPVHLQKGLFSLSLPLPTFQETNFIFPPGMTSKEAKHLIVAEDPKIAKLEFSVPCGEKITENTKIEEIFSYKNVNLSINETILDLKPTSTAFDTNMKTSKLEFGSLIKKIKFFKVHAILEGLQTISIPYEEYLKICSEAGVDEIEARELSRSFHKAGIFFHFYDDDDFKHQLFLKPEEFIEFVFDKYNGTSPILVYLQKQIAQYKQQEKQLQDQLSPMLALKQTLENQADAAVRKGLWGMAGSFGGGYAFYWDLTYNQLSWDIMEPTTFFTALGMSIVGYCWWMFTRREYEYESFYTYFFTRSVKKRFQKAGFSLDSLKECQSRLYDTQNKLYELELHANRLELFRLSKSNINNN